jgi:hypothetical protein
MNFKTKRKKLPPDAFAIGPDVEPEPLDPIDEETWDSIVSLPDDVSIRTAEDFGTDLKNLWYLWEKWLDLVLEVQNYVKNPPESPMSNMVLDCTDHFQSSLYNTLVGFYREGMSSMRNVLESLTKGSYLQFLNNPSKFQQWLNGDIEISFGEASDSLLKYIKPFENQLRKSLNDDLYSQKTKTTSGGLIRRLHRELCPYTHGAPGNTNLDIWQSNGPIYVPDAFNKFKIIFIKAYIIGFILTILTFPKLMEIEQEGFRESLRLALSGVPPNDLDKRIIQECLKNFYNI